MLILNVENMLMSETHWWCFSLGVSQASWSLVTERSRSFTRSSRRRRCSRSSSRSVRSSATVTAASSSSTSVCRRSDAHLQSPDRSGQSDRSCNTCVCVCVRWTWRSRRTCVWSTGTSVTAGNTRCSSCLRRSRRKLTARSVPHTTGVWSSVVFVHINTLKHLILRPFSADVTEVNQYYQY